MMYPVLNATDDITHCGNFGHTINDIEHYLELAKKYHFKGVNLDLQRLKIHPERLKDLLAKFSLIPVSFNITN